jgi:hypothetical protein
MRAGNYEWMSPAVAGGKKDSHIISSVRMVCSAMDVIHDDAMR